MTVTVEATGTQTATVSTEHTLNSGSFTGAKTYMLRVDTDNLANGDVLELRVKAKVLTGGSEKVLYLASYAHDQGSDDVIKEIVVSSPYSTSFTLKQTAGTGRAFDWHVISL